VEKNVYFSCLYVFIWNTFPKTFFSSPKRPDWLWDPPSLLVSVYWGYFLMVQWPGHDVSHSAPRVRMSWATPIHPPYAYMAWIWRTLYHLWYLFRMLHYRWSHKYKVVQIWPGMTVCKQVTVCPGRIWTTLYNGHHVKYLILTKTGIHQYIPMNTILNSSNGSSVVLELLHVDRHTGKASVTATSANFLKQICQKWDNARERINILNMKCMTYKPCNIQTACSSCCPSTHLKYDHNTTHSSRSLKYDDINALHTMLLLLRWHISD
jgi:hypothetical protein